LITNSDTIKFVERIFGAAQVYTSNLDVKCPFCEDSKKKRLSIRMSDHICHCWVCGWGGSFFKLVIKFGTKEQLHEYKEKFLPELTGITSKNLEITNQNPKQITLPADFGMLALQENPKDPDVKGLKWYLKSRGLNEKDLWRWKLGFSNKGNLRRRVIMPSFDSEGKLNFYVARAIDSVPFKYTNCEIDKNTIVFNEINIDWKKKLVLVEGPFDLMKCNMNATCLLGSSISPKSLLFQKIVENETPVVLMLDDEMEEKSQAIGKLLTSFNIDVSIVRLRDHHDPGEMNQTQVAECVRNATPWSWRSFLDSKISKATLCSLKI
jgi:DNA primase